MKGQRVAAEAFDELNIKQKTRLRMNVIEERVQAQFHFAVLHSRRSRNRFVRIW